ncbi:TPA: HesA/MoeB/ThiF family protein [Photobacterium damselae]
MTPSLTDHQFLRYSRQLMVSEISEQGQSQLAQAKVLIIGAGGLGSIAALYLAGAGIGALWLADGDKVELSNLARQILYRESDLGRNKAVQASVQLSQLNPTVSIVPLTSHLHDNGLVDAISRVDLVLDCSDNFTTRYAVNKACMECQIPLISGAAIGWQGQVISFGFHQSSSPCYHCLYPQMAKAQTKQNCQTMGVVGPLVGVIGAVQALEAIKYFTVPQSITWGELHRFNGLNNQWQSVQCGSDVSCLVCQQENENEALV